MIKKMRRAVVGSVILLAAIVVLGVVSLSRSAFRAPGYFQFQEAMRPSLDLHIWLPDCDGDGYPDLATVFRDTSRFGRVMRGASLSPDGRRRFSRLYSGASGEIICHDEFVRFNGVVETIEGYDRVRNQLDVIRSIDSEAWLFHGDEAVRRVEGTVLYTDEFGDWLVRNRRQIAADAGMECSEEMNIDRLGVFFDAQAQSELVALHVFCELNIMSSRIVFLDQSTQRIVRSIRIHGIDEFVHDDESIEYFSAQVIDVNDDLMPDFVFRLMIESEQAGRARMMTIKVDGITGVATESDEPFQGLRDAVVLPSGLRDIDRVFEIENEHSLHAQLKFERLDRSTGFESRHQFVLDWDTRFSRLLNVHEVDDFNDDGFPELSVFGELDSSNSCSIRLFDGATLQPFANSKAPF